MYNITKKEIGNRLRQIRTFLSITQQELSEEIGCSQIAISRMEAGTGVWENFLKMFTYYGQFIYLNCLFQEEFHIISVDGDKEIFKNNVNSIAQNIITEAVTQHREEMKILENKLVEEYDRKSEELQTKLELTIKKGMILISD